MPSVRKIAQGRQLPRSSPSQPKRPTLTLPAGPNVPPDSLSDYVVMLYGAKGIGKSSLASQNPKALTFMFEPRRRNLPIWQIPNDEQPDELDWQLFKSYLELACDSDEVQSINVDSVDLAYDACLEYVCAQRGITHPGQGENGPANWKALEQEFTSTFKAVLTTGKGIWFISHARNHTNDEVIAANRFAVCMPSCSPACFRFMKQICDFIFYYGWYNQQRAITVRGQGLVETGAGVGKHFLDPSGQPLNSFYVGDTPEQAYQDIQDAYDNKLYDVSYAPPLEETSVKKVLPKRKARLGRGL